MKAAYERHTQGVDMSNDKVRAAALKKVYEEIDSRVLDAKQRDAMEGRRYDPWKGR